MGENFAKIYGFTNSYTFILITVIIVLVIKSPDEKGVSRQFLAILKLAKAAICRHFTNSSLPRFAKLFEKGGLDP